MAERAHAWEDLAVRIARACPSEEGPLFGEAADLLAPGIDAGKRAELARLIRLEAFHDSTVRLYRLVLPEFGFQFGIPPLLPDGTAPRPVAIAWRRGDRSAIPYRAATPALALLAAAAGEAAKTKEADARNACRHCRGLGWYLTCANMKEICRRCRD